MPLSVGDAFRVIWKEISRPNPLQPCGQSKDLRGSRRSWFRRSLSPRPHLFSPSPAAAGESEVPTNPHLSLCFVGCCRGSRTYACVPARFAALFGARVGRILEEIVGSMRRAEENTCYSSRSIYVSYDLWLIACMCLPCQRLLVPLGIGWEY